MSNQIKTLLFVAIVAFMATLVPVGLITATADSGPDIYQSECLFSSVNHSNNSGNDVYNDILNGSTGQGYNLEEEYWASMGLVPIMPMALDSKNSCDDFCSSCGPGRANGGTSLLSTGCRNHKGWSYGNYGATNIPFWINMTSMNTIANATQRNQMINDLRDQAAMWNLAVMHDGTGQIVNLYETGIGSTTRPANISGRRVVEFLRLDGDYAGQFSPSDMQVRINYSASGWGEQGRNVDTPVHEMGHLLGLMDLDSHLPESEWSTHLTLMGYNRSTTRTSINSAIKYQDIQGIAVLNNRHTCLTSHFQRYIRSGNNYLYICFYCDRIDSRTSIISGSQTMADTSTCVHDYQQMVSHGERHWLKCTKCYKVVESEFIIQGVTNNTLKVNGLINTNKTSISIPNQIGGQTVTSIGDNAFSGNPTLSKISIPSSVTSIGNGAFKNCSNLTSISPIPNIQSIGAEAFYGCGSLSNISIPAGLTSIGQKAFAGCDSLNISVAASNPNYSSAGNIFYNKNKTVLYSAGNIVPELTIPSSVTAISPHAFAGNEHLSVLRFAGSPAIGEYTFGNCSNLISIYFYSLDIPDMEMNSFASNDFTAYVPYVAQQTFRSTLANYTDRINSIPVSLSFTGDGAVLCTTETY